MAMKQGSTRELRQGGSGDELLFEELAEQERLAAERLGSGVTGEEVGEFVPEDGDAGGLESDDGDSGFDLGFEMVENLEELRLGAIEHAEVVERASAAELDSGDADAESGGLQDFDGGPCGRGQEVVVEGVRPEQDGRSVRG